MTTPARRRVSSVTTTRPVGDRKVLRSGDERGREPFRGTGRTKVVEPGQEFAQDGVDLDAGDVRAQTELWAAAERDVVVGSPSKVQDIRSRAERLGISVPLELLGMSAQRVHAAGHEVVSRVTAGAASGSSRWASTKTLPGRVPLGGRRHGGSLPRSQFRRARDANGRDRAPATTRTDRAVVRVRTSSAIGDRYPSGGACSAYGSCPRCCRDDAVPQARGQIVTVGSAGNVAGRASTPFTESTHGREHWTRATTRNEIPRDSSLRSSAMA